MRLKINDLLCCSLFCYSVIYIFHPYDVFGMCIFPHCVCRLVDDAITQVLKQMMMKLAYACLVRRFFTFQVSKL